MYKRFLNNNDYMGIITEEAIKQLIREKTERFALAEEAAEESIVEYLTDNYEIEKELLVGKSIMEYNNKISYPAGAHFYYDGKIYETLRAISGVKTPSSTTYWLEVSDLTQEHFERATPYSQLKSYSPTDVVTFANAYYVCVDYNGLDFDDIRIPGVNAWEEQTVYEWQANVEYRVNEAVSYSSEFYMLLNTDDIDLTVNPEDSDNWGLIGEYITDYAYELSDHEFVKFDGKLYLPVINPVADEVKVGYNVRLHDPRNPNIKKHLVRLALYELHKLISPNNISSARISDYEASITWLRDANKLRINPQIPRKLDEEGKPVTEFAVATYARDYNPYENPWQV